MIQLHLHINCNLAHQDSNANHNNLIKLCVEELIKVMLMMLAFKTQIAILQAVKIKNVP